MLSQIKIHLLPGVLFFAAIASSCSIEIAQTAQAVPSPSNESTAAPSASLFALTHIPVTWSRLNLTGKLVYIGSTTEGNRITGTIQMLDLATGNITSIFSAPQAWIYYATVSPDAKMLVMSYAPPRQSNALPIRSLYAIPLDESREPQPVFTPPTPTDRYTQVEWSPDGKYIYYVHYNQDERSEGQFFEDYDIWRMTYPEAEHEKIMEHAFWPRLSFDSTKLVYVSLDPDSGRNELFVADADGRNSQRVAFSGPWTPEIIDAPIFSPDGQSILFSAPGPVQAHQLNGFEQLMGIQVAKAHNVPSDWWSVPVSGGVPTQLTNIQAINLFASISPDKKHIASISGEGMFVMDWNGSNLTQLLVDPGLHGTINWIP